jgi:hypothetical protein
MHQNRFEAEIYVMDYLRQWVSERQCVQFHVGHNFVH